MRGVLWMVLGVLVALCAVFLVGRMRQGAASVPNADVGPVAEEKVVIYGGLPTTYDPYGLTSDGEYYYPDWAYWPWGWYDGGYGGYGGYGGNWYGGYGGRGWRGGHGGRGGRGGGGGGRGGRGGAGGGGGGRGGGGRGGGGRGGGGRGGGGARR